MLDGGAGETGAGVVDDMVFGVHPVPDLDVALLLEALDAGEVQGLVARGDVLGEVVPEAGGVVERGVLDLDGETVPGSAW